MELVSIIIPTHKGWENIARAVESALNQTYKNIEIIVVDDNGLGTEEQIKTEAAMSKFAEYENVKYIPHEKNINGSAARNTGIRSSKGDYIAFLDDDDCFEENNIEKHLEKFKELSSDYGVTYCAMRLYTNNGRTQDIIPQYEGDILYDFLCGKIRIGSSLIMVKREAIDYVKEFDESFRRHQDWEFLVRILDKYKAGAIKNIGVKKYNLGRNNAASAIKFEENRLHYLNKMKYIIDKFQKKQQNEIYNAHYFAISKEYLRTKDFKNYISWLRKTTNPLKFFIKTISAYLTFLKKVKG